MDDKVSRQIRAIKGKPEMENRPRILIVDDEPAFVASVQAALVERSYQVSVATCMEEAQRAVSAAVPDVAVIGTITPCGDAFALHCWMKSEPPLNLVPMVVIDAPAEQRVVKGLRRWEGLRLECEDYLIKPVDAQALATLIEKLLHAEIAKIRVLVVDDQAVVRDAIRALIALQRDMVVVGEAMDGNDAVEKVRLHKPDIVLMDIVMPGLNGIKATERIHNERRDTKVLMLSQYDNDENIRESGNVGACGFISKSSADTDLLSAIRSAS